MKRKSAKIEKALVEAVKGEMNQPRLSESVRKAEAASVPKKR